MAPGLGRDHAKPASATTLGSGLAINVQNRGLSLPLRTTEFGEAAAPSSIFNGCRAESLPDLGAPSCQAFRPNVERGESRQLSEC